MTQPPKFTNPGKPDPVPILQIHRRHDGWISFHRKDEAGKHEDLFSVRARDIDNYFPSMSPLLERDSYFSINASYRGKHGVAKNSPRSLYLPLAEHKTQNLRWLTACFADIDCHYLGLTTGQAIGAIVDAQDEGRIPPASMLTRSGRGIWAFWILVDDEDHYKPVRAWPDKIRTWCNIQNHIGRELASIGADANARDPVRITRVPGSINTKSRKRVSYWIQGDEDGRRYVYGLSELAELLGVRIPQRTPKLEAEVETFERKRAKGAWTGRWINARENFERLWEMRGTFGPGTRNAAVFLYVTFLRGLRLDDEAIWPEAWRLFESMEQPASDRFTKDELKAAVRSAKGAGNVSNQRISDMLDVTPDESLVLTSGRGWPPASRFGGKQPEQALSAKEKIRRRRDLLRAKVNTLETWPGLAVLAEWLTEQRVECTINTVKADLEALGIRNPKSRPRKPKRERGPGLF